MKIEKVVVNHSDYGTCLRWEHETFRYHLWLHNPGTVFKNPPSGVDSRHSEYFRTRPLNAATKANAAMVVEAQRIATEQGLYEKAEEEKRHEEDEEKARQKAAIVLGNKRKAAEEMYEALKELVSHFGRCENPTEKPLPNPQGYAKNVEMVACGSCKHCRARKAIDKADGK